LAVKQQNQRGGGLGLTQQRQLAAEGHMELEDNAMELR